MAPLIRLQASRQLFWSSIVVFTVFAGSSVQLIAHDPFAIFVVLTLTFFKWMVIWRRDLSLLTRVSICALDFCADQWWCELGGRWQTVTIESQSMLMNRYIAIRLEVQGCDRYVVIFPDAASDKELRRLRSHLLWRRSQN